MVHASQQEPAEPSPGPTKRPRKRAIGPFIPIACLVAAILIGTAILIDGGFNVDTLLDGDLAVLTMIGVPFFILTFACRPLHDLFHTRTTAWLLANRRYLGLSFAAWHLMHWPILISVCALMGATEFWHAFREILIPSGSMLVLITVMAATSTNRAVRFLGKPLWSAIHTIGIYVIWSQIFNVYVGRLLDPVVPVHQYIYLALLVVTLLFRWIMTAKRLLTRRAAVS